MLSQPPFVDVLQIQLPVLPLVIWHTGFRELQLVGTLKTTLLQLPLHAELPPRSVPVLTKIYVLLQLPLQPVGG